MVFSVEDACLGALLICDCTFRVLRILVPDDVVTKFFNTNVERCLLVVLRACGNRILAAPRLAGARC
jgi:hypothetical protein